MNGAVCADGSNESGRRQPHVRTGGSIGASKFQTLRLVTSAATPVSSEKALASEARLAKIRCMKSPLLLCSSFFISIFSSFSQESSNPASALPPIPPPIGVPAPAATNDAPYAPQPIVQGGIVIPLYPPDSPHLKKDRIREAEQYSLSKSVPGRINSIINIHNPSIEVHTVDAGHQYWRGYHSRSRGRTQDVERWF